MDTPGKVVTSAKQNVILFDGVCNLCNSSVGFIIKRDRRNKFLFSSLQSAFSQGQLKKAGMNTGHLYSIVLLKENKVILRSDAALEIAKDLSGFWPALYILKIFPRVLRDLVYNVISKNRYIFFGKRDTCMVPTPEMKAKFIE